MLIMKLVNEENVMERIVEQLFEQQFSENGL